MVLVPCYRCNRYHRIVPLGNMLSHHKGIVLKSSRPSLPLKKAPPLISVFSPQGRRGKPPSGARNRFALRLAGHQNPRQVMRDGTAGEIAVYSLQLIVYSLRLISWLFADNLQISC